MADVSVREALTQAIRYWEPRRLLYNGLLLIVVATVFVMGLPISRSQLNINLLLFLFIMAVLANVAYCACYVVDVAAQVSDFRATQRERGESLEQMSTAVRSGNMPDTL